MFEYFITFRALTAAQKARGILLAEGISAVLSRAPKHLHAQGCAFALRVHPDSAQTAASLLRAKGVAFSGVFRMLGNGQVREVRF